MSAALEYAPFMPAVARRLLGTPTEETRINLRYNTRGSLSIKLEDGTYYDHEAKKGGGVLDLIKREKGLDRDAAKAWMVREGIMSADHANDNITAPQTPRKRLAATYDYVDADGVLQFQVCRYEPKDFRQRRPDGSGWSWSVKGIQQVPYRLPDMLARPGEPVFVVEGEKDADNLAAAGVLATCNAGGANKWPDAITPYFQGRDVIILPDNDQPGRDHAVLACSKLGGAAKSVRVLALPDLPEKGDVSNWLAAGGTVPELRALAEMARNGECPQPRGNDNLPLGIVFADALADDFEAPDELVEGILTAGAGTILYGDSNSGKTFLAIDLACAIARGVPWMERQTEPGLVVYVASESPASVRSRLQAYQRHHGCKVPNFAIVQAPVNLYRGDDDTAALIDAVRAVERRTGQRAALVIGDTLARMTAGANENSGEDMGLVVGRFDLIRLETGAHFLLIHHSGKDAAKGARGHSSLRAAVDTEIEVTATEQGRCAEITKQRDLATKGDRIGFQLETIALGETKWGKPATTCVVLPATAPTKPQKVRSMGKTEIKVVGYMATLHPHGAKRAEIAKHFDGEIDRSHIYKAVKKLVAEEVLTETANIIYHPDPRQKHGEE